VRPRNKEKEGEKKRREKENQTGKRRRGPEHDVGAILALRLIIRSSAALSQKSGSDRQIKREEKEERVPSRRGKEPALPNSSHSFHLQLHSSPATEKGGGKEKEEKKKYRKRETGRLRIPFQSKEGKGKREESVFLQER